MIWIDSSFAVEFLLGASRAAGISLAGEHPVTLPAQYAEICAFFLRRDRSFDPAVLEPMELVSPGEAEALEAARMFVVARGAGSKASLADAMLAAVVLARGGELLAFDEDFRHLGLRRVSAGRWSRG